MYPAPVKAGHMRTPRTQAHGAWTGMRAVLRAVIGLSSVTCVGRPQRGPSVAALGARRQPTVSGNPEAYAPAAVLTKSASQLS
jgi:hypothetical protein